MKKLTLNLMKTAFVGGLIMLYSCGGSAPEANQEAQEETKVEETTPAQEPDAVNEKATQEENSETAKLDLSKGKEIYDATCKACHQENGEGMKGAFPPLAKSDYLLDDVKRAIKEIISGKNGEVTVNGEKYNSAMPPNNLTDEQIVDVMNYILNSWGNEGGTITLDDVKAAKK